MTTNTRKAKSSRGGKRQGAGRPPLPSGEARTAKLELRLTPDELATIEQAAAKCLASQVSTWARELLLRSIAGL